ncbi:MAG TPA: trypsin-like peptidase domain-containing protein [Gaiellaceae bacterium]|jgi:S1-C subfamily serine protease
MKRTFALLLAAAGLVVGVHAALARTSRATVQNGVVVVNTNLAFDHGQAAGTGIVLTSNGEVLTNNHVVRGASTIHVVFPLTKRSYAARVLGYDVTADVALLQLQHASGLATASIGNSSTLRRGQSVTAVGNAGGTGRLTVTTGLITGLGRTIAVNDDQGGAVQLVDLLETNASLRPGDSGGPLLDSARRVVGMDSAASASFSFRGSSDAYAIPINRAVSIAKQIAAGHGSAQVHIGSTAFLGVQAQPAGASDTGGVLVGGVVSSGPVAQAGVVAGDVLTALNGRGIASPTKLVSALLVHHPGDKVTLRWSDASGEMHTATITLASGPPQ